MNKPTSFVFSFCFWFSVFGFGVSAVAAEYLYVPSFSYRTGPFAKSGIPFSNGFEDYFAMLNARDGGIGGVEVRTDPCETGYDAKRGLDCYEQTKGVGAGALVYSPLSTGITLELIPRSPLDEIPVLSMGYGLSAAAVGERFPWAFVYPASYWSQLSSMLRYIDSRTGLAGQRIGYIYLDVDYGREPFTLFERLAPELDFEWIKYPIAPDQMEDQNFQWENVTYEKPDWMIMWGWGPMTAMAIREAHNIDYPMDRFIGNWWSATHTALNDVGDVGAGFLGANFSGIGADYPALQDILEYVVDAGIGSTPREQVGNVLYNRGVMNAVIIAEAITTAQKITGKQHVTGADVRMGLEQFELTASRLVELGLPDFTSPLKGDCEDHEGSSGIYMQRWTGSEWEHATDVIPPMRDVVVPLLYKSASDYIKTHHGIDGQTCG